MSRDYFEPTIHQCPRCDFGTGMRGMDGCGKCEGTGSVFRAHDMLFPNTEDGYFTAVSILSGVPCR